MKKTTTSICTLVVMLASVNAWAETNLLEEQLAARVAADMSAVFACQVGEQVSIDARGIKRVATDSSKILQVSAADDTLFITCQKTGTTQLTVEREDRIQSVTVRVGAVYETESASVANCGDIRGTKARVVLDRSGKVQQVVVKSEYASQTECILDSLTRMTWRAGEDFVRVARFDW